MILGDTPSPSRSDFLGAMLKSEYAFEDVEFSNNPAPVLQPGMRMSSRTPVRVVDSRKGQFIPYKVLHNARATNPYTSSTKGPTENQSPRKGVRSVKPTDKKFACELNNHGNCPIKWNSSCVNKTTERQVLFPRSNRAGMHVGKLIDRHGNTAKQWEKAPNSTNRILRQNRIEMNQSAASNFSQSATPLINQSQPRVYALTDQSEASNPGSFYYKSRCRSQFVSTVSPRMENSTIASRNTLSSIGVRSQRHLSNTPVRCQSTARVNYLSNNPVRCQATRVDHLSNTPVRRSVSPCYWSNTPVRRQLNPPDSTWTNLPRSSWINSRIQRQQTRRRRLRRSTLMCAMCAAIRLWSLPIIGDTCCRIIRWIWSGFLWCMTITPTRTNNAALDLEPDSDD